MHTLVGRGSKVGVDGARYSNGFEHAQHLQEHRHHIRCFTL